MSCPHRPHCDQISGTVEQPVEYNAPTTAVDWGRLVDRIRARDASAMEELYALFERGLRFYLYRQVGAQELEDKIHDIFLVVVQAIRRGELREPERLMGFVRTVAHRRVAAHIDKIVHERQEETPLESGIPVRDASLTPEEAALSQERIDLMTRTLRSMPPRHREILTRFYLQEQSQEQICAEMHLNDTQFRLLKSRAKARFGEKGRQRLGGTILDRAFSGFRH
jgi:RNA polymerase sigma-70 factor, ECF subfamily